MTENGKCYCLPLYDTMKCERSNDQSTTNDRAELRHAGKMLDCEEEDIE